MSYEETPADVAAERGLVASFSLLASLWFAGCAYALYQNITEPARTFATWYQLCISLGLLASMVISVAVAAICYLCVRAYSLTVWCMNYGRQFFTSRRK